MTRHTDIHNICGVCWNANKLPYQGPSKALALEEICCWCGSANRDGIYYSKDDSSSLKCRGECRLATFRGSKVEGKA